MSEREPDHTQDPRDQDTGNQMPEESPSGQTGEGTGPSEGTAATGRSEGPEGEQGSGAHDESRDPEEQDNEGADAPGTAGEGTQSTGNPASAG